jgi:hypothetical protein
VLLVAPGQAAPGFSTDLTNAFYNTNDISARIDANPGSPGTRYRVANTLGDLTKPENRFGRTTTTIPYRVVNAPQPFDAASGREGDDVLLNNVLAFDVQAYDPLAPIFYDTASGIALEPSDRGWTDKARAWGMAMYNPTHATAPKAYGAYVDLYYGQAAVFNPPANVRPLFHLGTAAKSGSTTWPMAYDTWSLHYENDGLDAAGNRATPTQGDLGANGLDDGGTAGIVDDVNEYDTWPPYSAPLRGIRVTIRVYEPDSQQVREAVVIQNFQAK